MTREELRTELRGPWPTTVEELQAEFPDWEIWRRFAQGRHGDWQARRAPTVGESVELCAPTPETLREHIRDAIG